MPEDSSLILKIPSHHQMGNPPLCFACEGVLGVLPEFVEALLDLNEMLACEGQCHVSNIAGVFTTDTRPGRRSRLHPLFFPH